MDYFRTPKFARDLNFGVAALNAFFAAGNFHAGNTGWGSLSVTAAVTSTGVGLLMVRTARRVAQNEAREAKREHVYDALSNSQYARRARESALANMPPDRQDRIFGPTLRQSTFGRSPG